MTIKQCPLTRELLDYALDLVQTNVSHYYGTRWSPSKKRKELRTSGMVYVVVEVDDGERAGFVALLVDTEPYKDDIERRVAYVYELQVDRRYQGKGVGTKLMGAVVSIAKCRGCEWIMLTHFRANQGASIFYEKQGFTEDWNSPAGENYVILSRFIGGEGPV
jgi:ribosomal protein S18 acetylase RimI-like enzyme